MEKRRCGTINKGRKKGRNAMCGSATKKRTVPPRWGAAGVKKAHSKKKNRKRRGLLKKNNQDHMTAPQEFGVNGFLRKEG